jgi:hypothetical protein
VKILQVGIFFDYGNILPEDFAFLGWKRYAVYYKLLLLGYIDRYGQVLYKYADQKPTAKELGINDAQLEKLLAEIERSYNVVTGSRIYGLGLEQNGCAVEKFDYRQYAARYGRDGMLSLMVERAKAKDIVFINQGELLDKETLAAIHRLGVKVAITNVDGHSPIGGWLKELLSEADYFFLTSGGEMLEAYFEAGGPGTAAYFFDPSDPALFPKLQRYASDVDNIIFTGGYYDGISGQPRRQVVDYLKTRKDICFYGGAEYDSIGSDFILWRIYRKLTRKRSRRVRGWRYLEAITKAKIAVSVSNNQDIELYTSDRLSNFLSAGTFTLAWHFPGVEKLFDLGKELITFNSIKDLDEKIEYYLKHAKEREQIARAGQKKVLEQYNTKNIIGMMLDIVQTGKSDRFPWVQVYRNAA